MNVIVRVGLLLSFIGACGRNPHHRPALESPRVEVPPDKEMRPERGPESAGESLLVAKDPLEEPPPLGLFELSRWVDKAALILTGRVLPVADRTTLEQLPRAEIVAKLMEDPGFEDTAMEFSLYFLGFRQDRLRDYAGNLSQDWLALPHVLSATRAFKEDGHFFERLVSLVQPLYIDAVRPARLPSRDPSAPTPTPTATPDPVAVRTEVFALIDAEVTTLEGIANAPEGFDVAAFCTRMFRFEAGDPGLFTLFYYAGVPSNLVRAIQSSPQWTGGLIAPCFFKEGLTRESAVQRLAHIRTYSPKLRALLDLLESEGYRNGYPDYGSHMKSVSAIRTVDPLAYGLEPASLLDEQGFFQRMPNSSTNYDRKRAAYVLKRFFCDDLTPLSVVQPDVHKAAKHASDPSCQSCHYKLDPMAGFFRERGLQGENYADKSHIIFDDGAKVERAKFAAAWQAPAGSGREWDVGFVRSAADTTLNSYGSSLEDLFGIIAAAPEVKQCLVKRMVEYFVARDQVMDGGYLDWLSAQFAVETTASGSATAFKRTLARLVVSQAFATPDLNSSQCYDFAPGTTGSQGRPPCAVSFVLEKNCATCHRKAGAGGGLDLTGWVPDKGGGFTFPHVKDGNQLTRKATFTALVERLTTTDEALRMPLGRHISVKDREDLFRWADTTLSHMEDAP